MGSACFKNSCLGAAAEVGVEKTHRGEKRDERPFSSHLISSHLLIPNPHEVKHILSPEGRAEVIKSKKVHVSLTNEERTRWKVLFCDFLVMIILSCDCLGLVESWYCLVIVVLVLSWSCLGLGLGLGLVLVSSCSCLRLVFVRSSSYLRPVSTCLPCCSLSYHVLT
jgi:hypothetical protein